MGKKGWSSSDALWDDSALIDAFDHAIATYKDMHTKREHGGSHKEGDTAIINEKDCLPTEKTWHIEHEDNDNTISNDTTEAEASVLYDDIEAAKEELSGQESQIGEIFPSSESEHPHSSGFPCADGNGYGSDQQNMEYEQLHKQYYELEEQKQRVAQQLYQANYWNYQTPVQSSTCQTNQVSVYNTSAQGLNNPCSLCSCQCISVPLIPTSACAIGGMPGGCYNCPSLMAYCSGSQLHEVPCSSHVPVDNDNAVKAGMLAAEKAINSMKLEIGAAYNACGEKEKGEKSSGTLEGNLSQAVSTGSDFTAVLNAWYLAGLHTGRYLTEQSKKNDQQ